MDEYGDILDFGDGSYINAMTVGPELRTPYESDGVPWWQQTLDYALRAAVDSRYRTPALSSGVQYQVDPRTGQLVRAGVPGASAVMSQSAAVPTWLIVAGVVVAAVIIVKVA